RLAWFLAMCADEPTRDPKRAVELARKAVELAPQDGGCWNTLGAANFRAGDRDECLKALEKSMQLRQGGDALDWLFLAMVHHQEGNVQEAKKWLNQSRAIIARHKEGKFDGPLQQVYWQANRHQAEALLRE